MNISYREWGRLDCEDGLSPQSDNKDYLDSYGEQYALEQQLTAQGEKNEFS